MEKLGLVKVIGFGMADHLIPDLPDLSLLWLSF